VLFVVRHILAVKKTPTLFDVKIVGYVGVHVDKALSFSVQMKPPGQLKSTKS
jgi:hypothetical protein